jgi:hypothetical protein
MPRPAPCSGSGGPMKEGRTVSGERASVPPEYDLLSAWSSEPHAPGTIALCNWLAGIGPAPWPVPYVDRDRLLEFGQRAANVHASRAPVLLALGRMFLAWRELSAALTTLVRAASLAPHEPLPFRLLGEVLFRRGDAQRAARVFERAMAGGMTDADTRAWADAARAYAAQPGGEAARPSAPPPPYADVLLANAPRSTSRPAPPMSMRAPAPDNDDEPMVDPASFQEDVG